MPYGITTPAWVFALESATDKWLDGRIAEPTLFVGDIGDDGFAALAAGVAPHEVAEPVLRLSLLGSDLRCPWSDITATIAGSVPAADHPSGVQAGISVPQRWGNIIAAPVVLLWDPTNYGVPIWWLDAAVGVEEAPANPCEDGDDVMSWLDLSATGMDYDQLVPPNTPTWHVNVVNGLPAVRFDGANSFMEPAGPEMLGALTEFTGMWVFKINGAETFNYVTIYTSTVEDWAVAVRIIGTAQIQTAIVTDAGVVTLDSMDVDASAGFVVVVLSFTENGTANLRVNNASKDSDAIGMLHDAGDGRYIGTNSPSTNWFNGDVAEIVYYGAELSDVDIASATAALMTKYGI